MTKHAHEWVRTGIVLPGDNEELKKVEPARHPRTGEPFDFSDPAQVAFAKELGIEGVGVLPPAREPKVIFDCSCGETRHVPMKDGVHAMLLSGMDAGSIELGDVGRMDSLDLIDEVPA